MSFRLEVDPDQVREARGPAPRRGLMVAFVAALVLGGSAAGVWAAWRVMAHHGDGGAVPLIRADLRPVKVPPANPGGMTVPDQDKYILNRSALKEPRVEQLLPPPETPLPRPVPSEPAVTEAAPAAPPPVAVSPNVAAPAVSPPVTTPAPAPIAAPVVDPALNVAAVTAPAVAPATAPPPPPPAPAAQPASPVHTAAVGLGAAYRLQVGALRSNADAEREWARLKAAQPDILGMLAERIVRIDRGAQGVFYRIEAGPMADADAGTHACDELKRRKVGCILVKP